MARSDWQTISGSTNNNNAFFTGIRWRYRDDLFGTTGYPTDRVSSNTDIIEYQPYVGKKSSSYTSRYYSAWLSSNYKYSYNTASGSNPGSASNQLDIQTTFRFDQASTNATYYLTQGSLSSENVMNTSSDNTTRIIQVPHCSDGTSKLRLYFYFAGNSGTSFTYAETEGIVTLETIPRASEIGVLDANIGASTNITINKLNNAFTTSLYYKAAGQNDWTLIVDKTNLYVYPWTVPTSFYALIPNSPTIACEFKAETYNGTTKIGEKTTTATFTATGSPLINDIILTDTNSTTVALTGDNTTMIRNASNVRVQVEVQAQNSASITSVKVNGSTATLNNGVATITFNKATTNIFEIKVTDSRGYITEDSKEMACINYIPLTLDADAERNTSTDGNVNISVSGNYFNGSLGNTANTLTVQYRFKESTASSYGSWTSMSPTITNNGYSQTLQVSGFDYQKQYDIQVRAVDKINTVPVTGIQIKKGIPIVWWNGEKFVVTGDLEVLGTIIN